MFAKKEAPSSLKASSQCPRGGLASRQRVTEARVRQYHPGRKRKREAAANETGRGARRWTQVQPPPALWRHHRWIAQFHRFDRQLQLRRRRPLFSPADSEPD